VVAALITAKNSPDAELDFQYACAIDLCGRDPVAEVEGAIHPRAVAVPDPFSGEEIIRAADAEGVEVLVRARAGVRKCLQRIVGGAYCETLLARIGEAILIAVAERQASEVVARPNDVAREVFNRYLDQGTAFELLSLDISAKRS
jgi:uncharacterized protein YqfA (UPF0365 family)